MNKNSDVFSYININTRMMLFQRPKKYSTFWILHVEWINGVQLPSTLGSTLIYINLTKFHFLHIKNDVWMYKIAYKSPVNISLK